MRPSVVIVVVACVAAGCNTVPIELRSPLTEAEVAPYGETGQRFIAGEAFRRLAGGSIVTCAGEDVTLLPAVKVVEEAFAIWRSGDEIYTDNLEHVDISGSVRWTECDKDGNFVFRDLPPEKYYVMTRVRWSVKGTLWGGMLSERVDLSSGSAERLILDDDDRFYEAKPWELTSHLN